MKKIKTGFAILLLAVIFLLTGILQASSQGKADLSDPEVAYVAVVANQIDIRYAEIAKGISTNPEVLNFAQTMIRDHNAVIKMASDLAAKLGVVPKDNKLAQQLLADARKTEKSLKSAKGTDFDRKYVNNEVGYHKAVIAAIKDVLIPETENAELKSLLQKVLPALETHLGHAEMLQKKISK